MVKILIGNKCDVEKNRRQVQISDSKKYSEEKNMEFFLTSAKVNDGSIHDAFYSLAKQIKETFKEEELVVER